MPIPSLPGGSAEEMLFQHRALMVANLSQYDLFIFSENDMLVSKLNVRCPLSLYAKCVICCVSLYIIVDWFAVLQIESFLETAQLLDGTDYLPGFMRWEHINSLAAQGGCGCERDSGGGDVSHCPCVKYLPDLSRSPKVAAVLIPVSLDVLCNVEPPKRP